MRFGEPRYGWIGANVQEARAPVDGSRAVTTEVLKGTPAADAGLKPGGIRASIGRTKVHEPEDILEASFFLTAGDAVPITVARGNEKITFQVQADLHPGGKTRLAAPPNLNRAMPFNLQSMPEGTP